MQKFPSNGLADENCYHGRQGHPIYLLDSSLYGLVKDFVSSVQITCPSHFELKIKQAIEVINTQTLEKLWKI